MIKPGSWKDLPSRYDRACAWLANRATNDTIWGGCSALVMAKKRENRPSRIPASDIVSDVYSRSTGRTSERWGPWKCDECGQTYLGREAAAECCAQTEELQEETA